MPSHCPAERHSPKFPTLAAKLGAQSPHCHSLLMEEATELDSLRRQFIHQGLTPQQAHDLAWEIVRERYLFLPPEE